MHPKKPIIGLCSSYEKNEEHDRIFLNRDYLQAIRQFGGTPVVIPAEAGEDEQAYLLSLCDGLVLTGGNDIDPGLYGEAVLNDTVHPAPERDVGEPRLLAMAIARNIPILGICRGMQILNVYFGGTLYQDLPAQAPSQVRHSMEKPYHRICHDCLVSLDSPLYALTGRKTIGVNSFHHQAVKDVASGLAVMGRCTDGIVEAIYHPDASFIWAVQWHPEMLWKLEESSAKIFEAFISACQAKKQGA